MSYLGLPRIHFKGAYTAQPSTINNDPSNYDPAKNPVNPVWNPNGNAFWLFADGVVTSAATPAGPSTDLDGVTVKATDNWGGSGVPAKIVDLDPDQQLVSMLYGWQLQFGDGDDSVTGDFRPMWFQDLWGQGTGRPAGAIYQSVLENLTWGSALSPTLAALQAASPDVLSIKFTVDEPHLVPNTSNPNSPMQVMTGRLVGTLGPAAADAPPNFVPSRFLRPASGTSPMWFAPASFDAETRRLSLDLGNSVPWAAAQSGQPDLGTLQLAVADQKGPATLLGPIDYAAATYTTNALIQDFALTPEQATLVASMPLSVVEVDAANQVVATLLEENPTGIYVNATPYVFRMQANDCATCTLVATRFGVPHPDYEIAISDATKAKLGPGLGDPSGAIVFPPHVKTGPDGSVTFEITSGDPGTPRPFIDGQVYALQFAGAGDASPDTNAFLSLLVHSSFDKAPTWENIQPIMHQYARLYPFMNQNFFQLDDEQALKQHASAIERVFGFPVEDPRYMPVVRDLSDAKRDAILAWLRS